MVSILCFVASFWRTCRSLFGFTWIRASSIFLELAFSTIRVVEFAFFFHYNRYKLSFCDIHFGVQLLETHQVSHNLHCDCTEIAFPLSRLWLEVEEHLHCIIFIICLFFIRRQKLVFIIIDRFGLIVPATWLTREYGSEFLFPFRDCYYGHTASSTSAVY